jgi:hypothetical protein
MEIVHNTRMLVSQLLSMIVQFHGDVFRFYFAIIYEVQQEKEREKKKKTRTYLARVFFIGIGEHIKKKT